MTPRPITFSLALLMVVIAASSALPAAVLPSPVRIALVTTRGSPVDPTFRTDVLNGMRRAARAFNRVRLAFFNLETLGKGPRDPQLVRRQFADVPFDYFEVQAGNLDLLMDTLSGRFDVIIGVGTIVTPALRGAAGRFPHVRYVSLDGVSIEKLTNASNILQEDFREDEAAFLAGAIAAMKSRVDVVGFVGVVRQYPYTFHAIAFTAGVKYLSQTARVLVDYVGWDPPVARSEAKWEQVASAQYDLGADVIFASGASPPEGALRAAAARGRWVIGFGSRFSQNLLPQTLRRNLLTNMVKDYNAAVYDTIRLVTANAYAGGYRLYRLRNGGFDYLLDTYTIPQMRGVIPRLERIKQMIVRDVFYVPITSNELQRFIDNLPPPP